MRRIASRPSRGRLPCAARPRVSTSNHAKPLWPTAICEIGRLGHDRAVGAPARDQRVGADARVLLVHDRRDDQPSGVEAALGRRPAPRRSSRRRPPSCPASRGRKDGRRARPDRTARSSLPRRRCRCGRRASASAPAGALRARRSHSIARAATGCISTSSPRRRRCAAIASAISVSPAAPGTSDGFTELMATSSRRSLRAGSIRCSVPVLGARAPIVSSSPWFSQGVWPPSPGAHPELDWPARSISRAKGWRWCWARAGCRCSRRPRIRSAPPAAARRSSRWT